MINYMSVNTDTCPIETVKSTKTNIENLSEEDVFIFFNSLSVDCFGNSEFMEYYNEVLFDVLNKYPVKSSTTIGNVDEKKYKLILAQIANPLSDIIDIEAIKEKYIGIKSGLIYKSLSMIESRNEIIINNCFREINDSQIFNLTASLLGKSCNSYDLDGDDSIDYILWNVDSVNSIVSVNLGLSSIYDSIGMVSVNRLLNDDLFWLEEVYLVKAMHYTYPSLIYERLGDMFGVDVSSSRFIENNSLLLRNSELSGSIILYFDEGKLKYQYE